MHSTSSLSGTRLLASKARFLFVGETEQARACGEVAHRLSCENAQPFVVVDCRAPAPRVESELVRALRSAGSGTLLLLSVEHLPAAGQDALARAFSTRCSGDADSLRARVLASTEIDLFERVRLGQFRTDLYFRLSTFVVSASEQERDAHA